MQSPTLTRTLRRKRSSANASLTTRPSHLNLRDTCSPSLDTLVLVHMSTAPESAGASTHLVRALMEPNFLIDSQARVSRLDRETWERVRDSVEALRIVGTTSCLPLPTPSHSPDPSLPLTPQHQASARYFDVCPPTVPRSARTTSTLLMQPRTRTESTEPGVKSSADLLAFVIHGVGDGAVDEGAWLNLPNQIRVLLNEAENWTKGHPGGPAVVQEQVCETILNLVRS
ncbi:hypothetical protein CF319_g1362 [Tilletia indica]|uniref:Uncharacterized protein n=2 Tax=Tilletia TaxID=13289 RepID=A0A8X7T763_9BASI|nr:hypothetical protein CF327_g2632 [Tilletia walkeri]KAE8225990.1 hypothetical protein CF319_g1362 [Tilletia indica]KAE8234679.1 hypothetical protein CF326_g279 [Tilletia indica]KAE8254670.1 hypothetical protein A4X13_0g3328 [Tilletia indica]KAE8271019.1 hypothetical protein A4X09_0g1328 [Tilletia walkeri]